MENPIKKYLDKREQEKEHYRKHNPDGKPTRVQVIVKIVVGLYLFYLVYGMIRDGGLQRTGSEKILMIAAIVVFIGFGIYFCIIGVKGMMAGDFYDPNEPDEALEEGYQAEEEEDEEEEEEEEDEEPKSLSDLAKLSDRTQVPEDEQ